jgi:hypothetical protein
LDVHDTLPYSIDLVRGWIIAQLRFEANRPAMAWQSAR